MSGDFLPLIGAPRTKEEAQMAWPLRYSYWWVPRRALMVVGFGMVVVGIVSLFQEWESTDATIYMNTAKSSILIPTGAVVYWIGEVWSSSWKRSVASGLAIAYVVLGLLGIIAGDTSSNLGFTHINRPWEATIWLGLGAWTAITVWWPRRMFDYPWATGTSSGIKT